MQHVAFVVVRRPVERAELAERVADVGVIDVAIHVVGDDLVAATVVRFGLGEQIADL